MKEEECEMQADARRQIWYLQLPESIYKMLKLQRQTERSREDEYVFVFRRETHVQCLSLSIHLYYIKRAAARQDNSRNKAPLISSDTFNDVMYFAISSRGAAISRDIWRSYMIPGARRQCTAALDRGTNLSFALRYPPKSVQNAFKGGRREAARRHM